MGKKRWLGKPPEKCDVCESKVFDRFIDGKTKMGPWAFMCTACHKEVGVGLGLGLGQLFVREPAGKNFYLKRSSGSQ